MWALLEGADSSLWIGTYGGGLSRLKNGKFTVYTTKEGLAHDFVSSLSMDGKDGIWIGTDGGLSHFKEGRFTNYSVSDGLGHKSVRAVHRDRSGTLWIGTDKGDLNTLREGKLSTPRFEGPLPESEIRSLCSDRAGNLWIGSRDGLFRVKDGHSTKYTTAEGLSSNRVFRIHEGHDGTIWVGTSMGLDAYDANGYFTHQVITESSSAESVNAIWSDQEGSLWVGFANEGLARLRQGRFVSYTANDGLTDNYVASILQDRKGNLWIGTAKGLDRLTDRGLFSCAAKNGLPSKLVSSLFEDTRGYLWVATDVGLYRSRSPSGHSAQCHDRQFIPIKLGGLEGAYVRIVYEDRDGAIWVGTSQDGLLRLRNGKWETFTSREGLANNAIRAVTEDREGNLWIGTRGGGLHRFRNGTFEIYNTKDGLASDNVQGLYVDRDNGLWIATRQGVNRFKNGRFSTFTVNSGLYSNYVYGFVEDNHGNLWMSCSKGIFRVRRQQLDDFAEGKLQSVSSVAYGLEHGLSSTVGTVGHQPVGCKTSDGRIWFGTAKGICVVDPERLSSNTLPPPVHVEEVAIDQRVFDLDRSVEAPPGRGDLAIRYTGLSYLAPEKMRFRYRLEGYDPDWVEAGNRRAAYYSNIPPGRYTFRVIASNNDQVWNNTGDNCTIYLAPHFYETVWFYSLCICALGCMMVAAYRLRIRNLQARQQQLALLIDQRTKELQEQRGFLRKVIDLNPSFIFAKDRQGRFTLANEAISQAYGTTVENLIGKTDADFNFQQHQVGSFREDDLQVMNTRTERLGREEEFTDKNGDRHWLQVVRIPIISAEGTADHLLGVATDVTSQKRAGLEMQKAKEAAEAATQRLEDTHKELLQVSRQAGMAEVATGVLHNVGNVLNSVNVSASLIAEQLEKSKARNLSKVVGLMHEHAADLGAFFTVDPKGKRLPGYLGELAEYLSSEQAALLGEVELLRGNIEHIKEIVAMQQSYARVCGITEIVQITDLVEDSLRLNSGAIARHAVQVVREFETVPSITADKHKVLQILVNLIRNAKGACGESGRADKQMTIRVSNGADRIRIAVIDNGVGIPPENLTRIFSHGFTTRKDGHGYGLHSSALAAKEMGGSLAVHSDGVGQGAMFTLELPLNPVERRDAQRTDRLIL